MEIKEKIPIMTYSQYRRARKLAHQCCNYENGNCLALDDGEECVCVQSISYSLLCRWFRAAVLPLDESLEAALLQSKGSKAVYCLRATLFSRFQPGEILQDLCRHRSPQAENSQRPEKEGCLRTIRDEKTLILQAL